MSKPTLDDLPPRYQAQARAQLAATPHPRTAHLDFPPDRAAKPAKKAGPRIRQNSEGLNKTEQAFFEYLKAMYPHRFVNAQALTLKIANGCRYTPDFSVAGFHDGAPENVECYEVKGFMRDDAAVKIKVAATAYPWITFFLVTRGNFDSWNLQKILA